MANLETVAGAQNAFAFAETRFGPVDTLVNNAGIIRRDDSLEFKESDWDSVMNVNLKVVFFLSQAFAKSRIALGEGGSIINIASLLSFQGGVRVPSYTASKSGVAGLAKTLSNEWSPKGITVNAVAPGYVVSNNTTDLRNDPERNQAILERIPLGRWADPKDIAGAVTFLASPAARYVSGITLPVDGGWLGR
jgi:2-deoxy-D-gluconate 3-dehydrogenase